MISTPIRWLLMIGVAACGYFAITGSSTTVRAAAYIFSVVCWQFHYVVMMWEADSFRSAGARKKEAEQAKEAGAAAAPPVPTAQN